MMEVRELLLRRTPPLLLAAIAGAVSCQAPDATGPEPFLEVAADRVGGQSPVDIVSMADGAVIGAASLTRRGNGVTLRAHMDAEHGEAFTVWSAVFNNPEECGASPCGSGDLGNPDVDANVIRIAGGIAGGDGLRVSGRLREGDASEGLFPDGPPLIDATAAEIHFIYRSHGQKIPGLIDDQTMTLNGGCPPNACIDVAASIHLP